MQQQNIPIAALVDMYKRGEMRLPEIHRHYVWRATHVRDLCVPTDPALWAVDKYRDFLAYRRGHLAARTNEFIREKAGL
jgi:hypothetical protein